MSRVEENAALMDRLPRQYTGPQEIIQTKVMMDILAVLQDVSKSLAVIADAKEKKGEPYTCETCKHWGPKGPNRRIEDIAQCMVCYDYNGWEGKNV